MYAHTRGGVADFPDRAPRPECGHSLDRIVRRGELHIERHVIKRIRMRTLRNEADFYWDVGLCARRFGGEGIRRETEKRGEEDKEGSGFHGVVAWHKR